MPTTVTLTIVEGQPRGKEFILHAPCKYIVGRADCCQIHLPNDEEHNTVSRFHCAFEVAPTGVHVRDLGSRNGTYVNDTVIGQRHPRVNPDEAVGLLLPEYDLHPGDEVRVGSTVFLVSIQSDAATAQEAVGELACC